jgi:hypothetical protein
LPPATGRLSLFAPLKEKTNEGGDINVSGDILVSRGLLTGSDMKFGAHECVRVCAVEVLHGIESKASLSHHRLGVPEDNLLRSQIFRGKAESKETPP